MAAAVCSLMACSEPAERSLLSNSERSTATLGMKVNGYRFDAPEVRPWDADPNALDSALTAANGRLVVFFKAPASEHSLLNGGERASLTPDDFNGGLQAVSALSGSVELAWPALGAALVQVSRAAAHALLANPFVDFVNPDLPRPVPKLQVGGEMRSNGGALAHNSAHRGQDIAHPIAEAHSVATSYGNAELDANWSIAMIHGPEAWSTNNGPTDKVMIMTSWGIDLGHNDHPAIPTSNCGGAFGSCNGSDGYGYDGNLILGAWLARQNNYAAVGGAPGILGQNVFSWRLVQPGDTVWYNSMFVNGIDAAITQGIKTMLFVQFYTKTNHPDIASAVGRAWNNNIVMVAGIYGEGTAVLYPAAYSQVIGVSGALKDRTFANKTNPANECSNQSGWGSAMTKVAAPWTATIATSTVPDGDFTWCGGGIAAAYGASVASLLRSQNPSWTSIQIRDRLLSTASAAGDPAYFGSGIVNANAALTLQAAISGPSRVRPFATCQWSATGSGGNPPYSFSWTAPGASGTGEFFDYTNSSANGGGFSIHLKVTDVTGSSSNVSEDVSVSSTAPSCIF